MSQFPVAVVPDHLHLAADRHVGIPELSEGHGELLLGGGGLVDADEGEGRRLLLARRHGEVKYLGTEAGAGAGLVAGEPLDLADGLGAVLDVVALQPSRPADDDRLRGDNLRIWKDG